MRDSRPSLSESATTSVAIVGGGIVGISLAMHLARSGAAPILLEAKSALCGAATGASAGVVAPQLVRLRPSTVVKRLGRTAGGHYLGALAGAGRYCFEMIGDRLAECGAMPYGFIAPSRNDLARRVAEEWKSLRADIEVLDGRELEAATGIRGYASALLDPSGGGVNPVALGEIFADDAEKQGARLYVDSEVVGVERTQSGWRLRTRSGFEIIAKTVVCCANVANEAIHRRLRHTTLPLPVCQVATEPLSPAQLAEILPHRHALTDMQANVFSIRLDPDGRLITAYPITHKQMERRRLQIAVDARLTASIARYEPVPLQYVWSGVAAVNSDLLARVADLGEGMFAIQSCNGRGIALSGVIGREFGRWLLSDRTEPCAIPVRSPQPIRPYIIARHAPRILMKTGSLLQQVSRILATAS